MEDFHYKRTVVIFKMYLAVFCPWTPMVRIVNSFFFYYFCYRRGYLMSKLKVSLYNEKFVNHEPKASDFTRFSSVLSTSQVSYQAGKPIESVVYCFYKITLVFYEFTGTINHRFSTNQNARTFSVKFNYKISYPICASGIIVLLKTPAKYQEFFPTLSVKTNRFSACF